MRGVIGLTLVGGGIVLIVGLFTGKITIPFQPASSTTVSTSNTTGQPAPGNSENQTRARLQALNS